MNTTPSSGGSGGQQGHGPHSNGNNGGNGNSNSNSNSSYPADGPASSPAGGGFFAWLRGLGITRSKDRWFAGVAGGLAARIGIDPLIVRGAFVVLALLGGPGLLLYLAGWLLLPDDTGRIHVEDIGRGRASAGVLTTAIILAAVVVLPALIGIIIPAAGIAPLFSVWSWGIWDLLGFPDWLRATIAWLFWIAVLVAAGFWLRSILLTRGRDQHSRSAEPSQSASEPPPSPTSHSDSSDDWARNFSERAENWGRDFGERANRWGADVGRQADEWSARYAEHHDTHRLGAGQVVITLACALLAGGAAALWVASGSVDAHGGRIGTGAAPSLVAGVTAALAVLAVSLIVAGVRGRYTGWIGFLSFCGVLGLFATVALPVGSTFQPFGDVAIDGRTASGTVVLAGSTEIDLRELDLRTSDADIVLWQLAGQADVILPEQAAVDVHVRVLAGRIDEHRAHAASPAVAGPFLGRSISLDAPSAARPDSTGRAEVTIYLVGGNVDITGGPERGPLSPLKSSSAPSA